MIVLPTWMGLLDEERVEHFYGRIRTTYYPDILVLLNVDCPKFLLWT